MSLAAAQRHCFAYWPNRDVPTWRAGIDGVWRNDESLYVGIAGRGLVRDAHLAATATATRNAKGLRDRLDSHVSGRRSGDQFCIFLCDRLVVPSLTRNQLQSFGDGTLMLDALTKRLVHDYLTYAYTGSLMTARKRFSSSARFSVTASTAIATPESATPIAAHSHCHPAFAGRFRCGQPASSGTNQSMRSLRRRTNSTDSSR